MGFACVILAAGEGRRAGGCKPLMELGDELVIDRIIRAGSSICPEIRVVAGGEIERMRAHLDARWPGVAVVHNASWRRGMFSSVMVGLEGLGGPAFVHPADIPGPGRRVYEALAAAMLESRCDVARPTFGGRRGHPVLLSPVAIRAVLAADPSSTLRDALASLRGLDVETDDEYVLFDFDTQSDLAALRARLAGGGVQGGRE